MQKLRISPTDLRAVTKLPDIPESHLIVAIYMGALNDISLGIKQCTDYRKVIDTERDIAKRSSASIKFLKIWAEINASVDFICDDPFGLFKGNDIAWQAVRSAVLSDPDEV